MTEVKKRKFEVTVALFIGSIALCLSIFATLLSILALLK